MNKVSDKFSEKYAIFKRKTRDAERGIETVSALAELMGFDAEKVKPTEYTENGLTLYIYEASDGKKLGILDVPSIPPMIDEPKHDPIITYGLRDAGCYVVLETDMGELWVHYIKKSIDEIRMFAVENIKNLNYGEKAYLACATVYDYDMSVYQSMG